MGKIKSKLIKRTAKALFREGIEFSESFERNKKILGGDTMPSKKLRNQIAGYAIRLKQAEKNAKQQLLVDKI